MAGYSMLHPHIGDQESAPENCCSGCLMNNTLNVLACSWMWMVDYLAVTKNSSYLAVYMNGRFLASYQRESDFVWGGWHANRNSHIIQQFCLHVKSGCAKFLCLIISIESGASQAISTLCLGSIMRMVLTVTFMEL